GQPAVARESGVSRGMISLILSDQRGASRSMRDKLVGAIERLAGQPSRRASLSSAELAALKDQLRPAVALHGQDAVAREAKVSGGMISRILSGQRGASPS